MEKGGELIEEMDLLPDLPASSVLKMLQKKIEDEFAPGKETSQMNTNVTRDSLLGLAFVSFIYRVKGEGWYAVSFVLTLEEDESRYSYDNKSGEIVKVLVYRYFGPRRVFPDGDSPKKIEYHTLILKSGVTLRPKTSMTAKVTIVDAKGRLRTFNLQFEKGPKQRNRLH